METISSASSHKQLLFTNILPKIVTWNPLDRMEPATGRSQQQTRHRKTIVLLVHATQIFRYMIIVILSVIDYSFLSMKEPLNRYVCVCYRSAAVYVGCQRSQLGSAVTSSEVTPLSQSWSSQVWSDALKLKESQSSDLRHGTMQSTLFATMKGLPIIAESFTTLWPSLLSYLVAAFKHTKLRYSCQPLLQWSVAEIRRIYNCSSNTV